MNTPHPTTKISQMHQIDFIEESDLLYECRTKRACVIDKGTMIIGDGGFVLDQEMLDQCDIRLFHRTVGAPNE